MPHSPDIAQNSDGVFLTSGFLVKFLISKNDHNCRTTNDIDMKLRAAAKLDRRNTSLF